MNLREAAQQALEALEWNYATDLDNIPACEQWAKMLKENITALRAALAEPQTTHWEGCEEVHPECRTAPAPRKPLTEEEIAAIDCSSACVDSVCRGGECFPRKGQT